MWERIGVILALGVFALGIAASIYAIVNGEPEPTEELLPAAQADQPGWRRIADGLYVFEDFEHQQLCYKTAGGALDCVPMPEVKP